MKCKQCKAIIEPQWKAAINSNTCPGCGGAILDDLQKSILIELREAMSKMPNDPEGLAGWLISNYKMKKIGDAAPVVFHKKIEEEQSEEKSTPLEAQSNDVDLDIKQIKKSTKEAEKGETLLPQERIDVFAKRAGVKRLQSAVKEIQSYVADPSEFQGAEEEERQMMIENGIDPDSVEDFVPKNPLDRSSLNQMSSLFENNGPIRELELEKLKQMEKQRQLQQGGVGSIKRSS